MLHAQRRSHGLKKSPHETTPRHRLLRYFRQGHSTRYTAIAYGVGVEGFRRVRLWSGTYLPFYAKSARSEKATFCFSFYRVNANLRRSCVERARQKPQGPPPLGHTPPGLTVKPRGGDGSGSVRPHPPGAAEPRGWLRLHQMPFR